jgi:Protein of unknown function (DUF4038)/Bacterial Ig-like domain (group 3)
VKRRRAEAGAAAAVLAAAVVAALAMLAAGVFGPSGRPATTTVAGSGAGATPLVTGVSANGRYLVDQNGNPFLLNGDSDWDLAWALSPADQQTFLADRAQNGFNTVMTDLVGSPGTMNGNDDGSNYAGVVPFTGSAYTPNPAYWDAIGTFFNEAAANGISVLAIPIDAYATGNVFGSMSDAEAQSFGTWLSNRFPAAQYPGIVWMMGNDYGDDGPGCCGSQFQSQYQSLLKGFAAAGDTRPTTIEDGYNESYSSQGTIGSTVTLNASYNYHPTYSSTLAAYAAKDEPVFFVEGAYENASNANPDSPLDLRKQLGWTMTSGGTGSFYGNDSLWKFVSGWQSQLDTSDVAQRHAFDAAIAGTKWWAMQPDTGSRLVTAGRNNEWPGGAAGSQTPTTADATYGNYVTAAYTPDGTSALIYNPDSSENSIALSATVLAANPDIIRVDPTNGATTNLGWTTSPPGGTNAAGDHDWLYIITAGGSGAATSTTTTLTSSQNASMTGQQVTYTATVSPAPDGGTVSFSDGGTVISTCAAPLLSGQATCAITYATAGTHTVTAAYSGDSNFTSSSTVTGLSQLVTGIKGVFHALPTAIRITDTRTKSGFPNAGHHLVGGVPLTIQVAGVDGAGGVPASGAAAAVLNVTVTNPTTASYLTVWPTGSAQPRASNLNFAAGQTVPNLVEVGLGAGGQVSVVNAGGTTDVLVDVQGYTAPLSSAGAGLYNPLTPIRITDTRTNSGLPNAGHHLTSRGTLNVQVAGAGLVPTTGVAAVVLNVTVTNPTAASYLTVWPAGGSQPGTSNLNFRAGETVANRVIVPVGSNGRVSVFNHGGTVDVIADVGGYFTDGSTPTATGLQFTPIVPTRIADTRAQSGFPNASRTLDAKSILPVQVTGAGGVPTVGVGAAVLNVTVTNSTQPGFLTIWCQCQGVNQPNTSDLNWARGVTVPNLVVAHVGSTGAVSVYNSAGTDDVVVDVSGWYS